MSDLIPAPTVELVKASDAHLLLMQIRPAWQARDLISRVKRLVLVDPSSACQRLFNAAVHDLREKVVVAGIDIAKEAAKQHKLPPVERSEDIDDYSTAKLIDLAHRMGLLSRPDWRRLSRCYEIRRDLEHEDDEYEAGVEDCIYIFQTCISVVLSRDPIHLIRVTDVKQIVEQPQAAAPTPSLLQDFEHAPQPRQDEILRFVVSIAIDENQPELVRQNAFTFLSHFAGITSNQAKLSLAIHIQERVTRFGPSMRLVRVAFAAGVLPYLKQAHRHDFFSSVLQQMKQVGHRWTTHSNHGELLRSFRDVGGLLYCPPEIRYEILRWLVLAYLGEPGGVTRFGNVRHVFYSNSAAPLVEELITESSDLVRDDLRALAEDKEVRRACCTNHIERRMEALLDLVEETNSGEHVAAPSSGSATLVDNANVSDGASFGDLNRSS
jgi:hypothetical protein